jgi:hypothetical protein
VCLLVLQQLFYPLLQLLILASAKSRNCFSLRLDECQPCHVALAGTASPWGIRPADVAN